MPSWFLSYNSQDQALAERLKTGIEVKDAEARVFYAPKNLRPGGSWSAQLAQEIAEADAFILLIGEKGIGNWQTPEYYEAYDKWVSAPNKFSLVLVLLEGQSAPGLPFLRQLHWIVTPDPASETTVARLFEAGAGRGSRPRELWRYTSPYRGLEAMEEKDSDYFFGRKRETVEVLSGLAHTPNRLPVLIGNSGVGKSSLAKAGVLAALKREGWPEEAQAPNAWPAAFQNSRRWCFLTLKPGSDPLKALVQSFLETWQLAATDVERIKKQNDLIELLLNGKAALSDLIDATELRYKELDQPKPPRFFLYVDQGEELYGRSEIRQRMRFSELLAQGLGDPRLQMLMSMRSDFLGHLQADKSLFKVRQHIDVPPLGEEGLHDIVGCPAQLLSARFENDRLIDIISRRAAEDSVKDVGALPLLSYTLDDMWSQMVERGDGVLRLPAQSFELGGVLADHGNTFLETHPGAEQILRKVLTLRLASVRDDGEPIRRRAARSEFTDEEWRLVCELADYPNRLLVTVTTDEGNTFAEVAHETIFRRWKKLHDWIVDEREFLVWRSGLEAVRREWQATPANMQKDALLMGLALAKSQSWLAKRGEDLTAADCEFIKISSLRENQARTRVRRVRALVYVLLAGIIVGLVGWTEQSFVKEQWRWWTVTRPYAAAQVWPYVLSAARERALKPGDPPFKECAHNCPEVIVIPAGSFSMGPAGRPQHTVTFARPFAVSRYELTFADWNECVTGGGCAGYRPPDEDWGGGLQPAINVNWNHAQQYIAWLSAVTGKTYRLLSESEYEYAARAESTTSYPWGDDIELNGQIMANCDGCGGPWGRVKTVPVGSFPPNKFGLYDMVGNVWEWTQDCWHPNYENAPLDGSAWREADGGNCDDPVGRGGSFFNTPEDLKSAGRTKFSAGGTNNDVGFRVARTLQ